jgi:DNA polymerase-4
MPRKILHLDLDAFFCAVEELLNPELAGKAFAVGGSPTGRGVISSCSYAARLSGVHSAMPSARALRLCPGLLLVPARHGVYGEYSQRVMKILGELTPLVEQISIDEAFLDVSDLPEPGEVLARRLQAAIRDQVGLPCSLGVAANKLVAKIATDTGKAAQHKGEPPNAVTVVPPGGEAAFLAPLPVRAMWGVGPKTAARLAGLDIHTIGDLARLPPGALVQHFGQGGADFARRARGEDDAPVLTSHEVKSISNEVTFERDLSDADRLTGTLRELSESVGRRLRQAELRGSTVHIKLRWADFLTITRQVSLPQPTDQDGVICAAANRLFEQNRPKNRPVRLLGVGVSGLTCVPRQLSLWDTETEKEHRLLQAVDELRQRFGRDIIQRASQHPEREEPPAASITKHERPLPNSYWVVPGRFLAGEIPSAGEVSVARERLRRVLAAGITCFIDLTIESESDLLPYTGILEKEAARMGVTARRLNLPIEDMDTPSREQMQKILESISSALQAGENVYLHCWGGRGRTGTVVGCYLVKQGASPEHALEQIRRWRAGTPQAGSPSPETTGQIYFVMNWVG